LFKDIDGATLALTWIDLEMVVNPTKTYKKQAPKTEMDRNELEKKRKTQLCFG